MNCMTAASRMRIDLDDADGFGLNAQTVSFDQCLSRFGKFAKPVDQFFLQVIDLFLRFAVGEAFVKGKPFIDAGQ